LLYESERWLEVQGSFASSVLVKRGLPRGPLAKHGSVPLIVYEVSGNPTKFLQGQNVFGPGVSNMASLVGSMLDSFPSDVRPRACACTGDILLSPSRVDITVMVDLGCHELVHRWLRHAELETRSRHGRALVSGDTVYWGKHSRRWSLKAYCKLCELSAHPPEDAGFHDLVRDWVSGQLRIELTLRGQELRSRGLEGRLSESLVWDYLERVEVGVMKVGEWDNSGLPFRTRAVLEAWQRGEDLRHELKRSYFYKVRRELLSKVGIDISLPAAPVEGDFPRETWDLDWLKGHEVKELPSVFEPYLWRPSRVA
jgi:hypothetical protein